MDIFIQVIGIIAMAFNIMSYQGKKAINIIFFQFISAILFVFNFYMLGAYTGSLLNCLVVIRALFLFKVKTPPKYTMIIFFAMIFAIYSLTFIVFKKEPIAVNFLIELLPTLAMCVQTFSFYFGEANTIRYFSYFVSPCWLIYNIINFSIGGILCESFAIISITVGIIRSNRQKTDKKTQENKVS